MKLLFELCLKLKREGDRDGHLHISRILQVLHLIQLLQNVIFDKTINKSYQYSILELELVSLAKLYILSQFFLVISSPYWLSFDFYGQFGQLEFRYDFATR
jgi:hypothetical protein